MRGDGSRAMRVNGKNKDLTPMTFIVMQFGKERLLRPSLVHEDGPMGYGNKKIMVL